MLNTTDLTIDVDLDSLTIGEMIDIEEVAGVPIGDIGQEGKALSAKAMLAVMYVTLKRDHPEVTVDDVKALDVSVLNVGSGQVVSGKKEPVVLKSISKKG